MPSSSALPSEVLEALSSDWTVLTANQRAARTLRQAYDLAQEAAGRTAWEPPAILEWQTWLGVLWTKLLISGRTQALVLNPHQEHAVWAEIIQADAETQGSLRSSGSLAEIAAAAWNLVHTFRSRSRVASSADTRDTQAFARWATEFDRRASRGRFLSSSQLAEQITAAVTSGQITPNDLGPGFLLVGFDTKPPARMALLDAVTATGIPVQDAYQLPDSPEATLVSARSGGDELEACSRWLRNWLRENPHGQAAVIVPALEEERGAMERTLRHVLAPELDDIDATTAPPFEFSLGEPLAATAMVATALEILRWSLGAVAIDRITALLRSPYFADGAEQMQRAEFDAFILRRRTLVEPQLTVAELSSLQWRSTMRDHLPVLNRRLGALKKAIERNAQEKRDRTRAEWGAIFGDILDAAGWAAGTQTGSVEFQSRRSWETALDTLASLDFDSRRIAMKDALDALERIAKETLFAPESRGARVQVLGPLEAAGSRFDALWFLRAADLTWPVRSATNPLLSWRLQKELAMPGANLAYEADLARRITRRVAASAPTAIFSYSEESADSHQRPSAALAALTVKRAKLDELAPADIATAPVVLETIVDDEPIPFPEDQVIRGGYTVLQAQAACAFRAFAEKRLFSTSVEETETGLNAAERGNVIHKALELFWNEMRTQAALNALPPPELREKLLAAIDGALTKHIPESAWGAAYLRTERTRLQRLLTAWMREEMRRKPFAVFELEHKVENARVGPLSLEVRVDRIDTHLVDDQDAGRILLDYKTGEVSPSAWMGERPEEPQLPLYAILSDADQLAAMGFAQVRPGKGMKLVGFETTKGVLAKPPRNNPQSLVAQVEEWREVLTQLAEEFHAGAADVAPKQYPKTCRYCEQRVVCRLDPAKLDPEALEEMLAPDDKDPEADFA